MPVFCIPKNEVAKLKASALRHEVDIKALNEMSSIERRTFFTKHTSPELGKFINSRFEEATVSKQKNAMLNWAKSVFDPKAQASPVYKTILDKINSLDELGALNPKSQRAFLEDLVSDKLGINVTAEEVMAISKNAQKISAAQKKLGNDIGDPARANEAIEFFKAKKEMDDYLLSKNPANKLKVLTGTIGRGMMLASVKSPVLNIGSNLEVGMTEALGRRLANRSTKGTDTKLASDYVKMVNRVYQETGYDISRMTSITDTGASGGRVLGDTVHAQGPGAIRKVGRVVEDVVFKQLMGAPDVAAASVHFSDSVNLNALKAANGNKVKAREMMIDSMRMTPQTAAGELLRAQGILDAQVATWTNHTWASKTSEGIRKVLNDVSGDIRIGDFLMPFVKTPANVIATGMDYAGLGGVKALVKTVKAIKSGELGSKEFTRNVSRDLVRAGIGLTAATVISAQLNDDDFVGAYDPSRRQIESLRNSTYNAIRIGGKWISTDWLGPLSIPVTAMMYARKYGKKGVGEKAFQFGKGVASQALELPGVSDARDYFKSVIYKKDKSLEEATGEATNYLTGEASSRLIPSIFSDMGKTTDIYERKASKGLEAVVAKVPFLRETLPPKRNIFGDPVETEKGLSPLFFGSRVKKDKETPLIKEIGRVSGTIDKPVNFMDWDKSNSKKLAQFREKVGAEKFEKAKIEYGQVLKFKLTSGMALAPYRKMDDEEKHKWIIGMDTEVMESVFRKYGFHYRKDKK